MSPLTNPVSGLLVEADRLAVTVVELEFVIELDLQNGGSVLVTAVDRKIDPAGSGNVVPRRSALNLPLKLLARMQDRNLIDLRLRVEPPRKNQ